MALTGMLFLFVFLPASLAVYYISGDRAKEYVLLVLSLIFYSLGSLRYLILFLLAVGFTVAAGRLLACAKERRMVRKLLLAGGILFHIALLGYFKYTGRLLPLGLSFFTFKSISYLADLYRNKKEILHPDPVHDALYLCIFTQITSGPLTRYQDLKRISFADTERSLRTNLFADGVFRFMTGFCKKILLANVLVHITNEIFTAPFDRFSVSYAWLGSVCFSLQLFFDFSGYSDMAVGLSEMFGYRCMENFYYPYCTESVSRFWRRWHISLGAWFRDYVYIPLGGSRTRSRGRVYLNLLAVWLLTGIWHGAAWNYVIWGLGYFVIIAFERWSGLPGRFRTRVGKALYRLCTLVFINIQWVLFRSESLRYGAGFIKRMFFCEKNPLADTRTLFLIKDYRLFLLAAVLFSFPVIPWIRNKLKDHGAALGVFEGLLTAMLLFSFVWAVSFVVSGQNDPFAYANF